MTLVPDALDANRAGRLTDTQRKDLRAMSRGFRKTELWLAGVLVVMGLLVWFAEGPPKYAIIKPLVRLGRRRHAHHRDGSRPEPWLFRESLDV